MERSLEGRVALVTGAVRRIGRSIALSLAADGAAIVINTRNSAEEAEGVRREIEAMGGRAIVHLADVCDESAVSEMTARTIEEFGRLDILVSNAAIRRDRSFLEMSLSEWREVTGVILDGAFLCARAAIPHMLATGEGGRVVLIGGVSAHIGAPDRAHVIAAKAGLVGMTRALAHEFASQAITVNCVVPGKIGGQRSATSGQGIARLPITPREGRPEDVAASVRHVCQPSSDFITGQTLHVSGGMYLP